MSIEGFIPVDPTQTTFDRWASDFAAQLSSYNVPNPGPEDLWRDWASAVVAIDEISEGGFMNPLGFADWRDWARALLLILS